MNMLRTKAGACALAALLALAPAAVARAQDEEDKTELAKRLLEEGIAQLTAKKFDESIATYKKVIAMAEKHQLDEAAESQVLQLAHYNIACAYSLKGDKTPALDHFEKALDAGFEDYAHIEKDTDLDSVRGEPRFKQIVAKRREAEKNRLRSEAAKSISPTPLFDLDIDAKTIEGDKVRLKELRGKTVVVVYFGTWSARGLDEIRHLVRLREEYGAKGVEIVGIAYELGKTDHATVTKLKELCESKGIKYPVVLVGKEDPLLKKMPEGDQFPSKLFLDKEGKVRAAEVGYQPYEALEALVLAMQDLDAKPGDKKPADEKKPEEKKPEEKKEEKKPEKKPGVDDPI